MLEKQESISKAHLAAGRAVDQLRRQLGIVLEEDNGNLLGACPVEGLASGLLAELPAKRYLLLTGARARALGLPVAGEIKTVRLDAENLSLPVLTALADPLAETAALPELTPLAVTESHGMLLALAKYASLLPSMLTVESKTLPSDWLKVAARDVKTYWDAPPLDMVPLAQAMLPIEGAENARLVCFRQRYGTSTHLALVVGDIAADKTPLTRIHSSCVTGDILGSLRCDCGDQLRLALAEITHAGSGILIYLHQEGRGIGITNKIRAYRLQERGVDTYEANLMLGFDEDERDFSIAAAVLEKLGVKKIRLLTNNPHKIASLEKQGVKIAGRVPLVVKTGQHNHAYLDAKAKKSGHLF